VKLRKHSRDFKPPNNTTNPITEAYMRGTASPALSHLCVRLLKITVTLSYGAESRE